MWVLEQWQGRRERWLRHTQINPHPQVNNKQATKRISWIIIDWNVSGWMNVGELAWDWYGCVQKICDALGLSHMEVSSKTGENIDAALGYVTQRILDIPSLHRKARTSVSLTQPPPSRTSSNNGCCWFTIGQLHLFISSSLHLVFLSLSLVLLLSLFIPQNYVFSLLLFVQRFAPPTLSTEIWFKK